MHSARSGFVSLSKIIEIESRRLSLPVMAAIGMAVSFYPGPPLALVSFVCAVVASSLALALCDFRNGAGSCRTRCMRSPRLFALGLGLISGAAIAWNEAGLSRIDPAVAGVVCGPDALSVVWLEGRLTADSSPAKNGFRSYIIRVERMGLSGRGPSAELFFPRESSRASIRVLARAGAEVDSGALVRVRGRLSEGAPSGSSPGAAQGNSSGAAFFAQARDILVVDRGGSLDRARSAARETCRLALSRVGKKSAGLLQALILGVRDSLASEESEAFKAAGCSHILALSGEHLSVLAVLAIAAFRPLVGPLRARFGGAILASLFMWIAGAGPSLLRSVLMMWIGSIALRLDRPQEWLVSLALSFLLMVSIDPESARSLSFTLSYLAVLGLAVLGARFSFALGRILPPFLLGPASAALAAQAAVWPLLAFSFGCLQLAGIPASIAAGPLVTATMWWGMGAGLLCSIFPFAVGLVIPVSDFLYSLLMGIMNTAAAAPIISLPSVVSRIAASLAVVGIVALVYARPYAEYGASLARLRLSPSPAGPSRGRGPGHVQALRAELSD
jgi:ComEC/Rec2-related protein